jgi:glycosyltransferase involved in cell wall biosynthesis
MLAECLESHGVRCDFFFMPNNPPLDTETTASLFMPLFARRLRRYDFIHCGAQEAGQALFLARPLLKGPVILDMHGDVVAQSALANELRTNGRRRTASLRVRLIDRLALWCADHILTVSSLQAQTLVAQGVPPRMITLVRNGVDLELFRKLPFPSQPRYAFCYAGEFQTWQGTDNLVAALERTRNCGFRTLIIGFRPKDEALKRMLIDKLGNCIETVDRTDRQSLVTLIEQAAVLIIPRIGHQAIRHAFPTKFAEYAANGRPILVNDVDETAMFVKRHRCGFVSRPDPDAMAETMRDSLKVGVDEMALMGDRARKMAEEHFSWEVIGDTYAALIDRLVTDFRKGRRRW